MPRKHRAARERSGPPSARDPLLGAPEWAFLAGFEVRSVTSDKPYRCPGCDLEIRPGVPHIVVVPTDDPGSRRHWHTECWRRELRLIRGR